MVNYINKMKFIKILFILYNSPIYVNKLVNNNMGLVHYFAKPYLNRNQKLTYDEKQSLYQEGYLGMCYAARKYNITKGYKFSTYSSYWIRRYLQLEIERINRNKYICVDENAIENSIIYDYLDLNFLSDYEYDIITSFYLKRERQSKIADRYNIKIYKLQRDIKLVLSKIKKSYLF